MKAVLRRFNTATRKTEKVVLAEKAQKLNAVGDIVRVLSAANEVLAVARLAQGDYVSLEREPGRPRVIKLVRSKRQADQRS